MKCGEKENVVVHHVDCNHENNVISNLQLLCNSCHTIMHNTGVVHAQRTRPDPIPHDGILEYLSRPARRKITKTLCKQLVNNKQLYETQTSGRNSGRPDYLGISLLAARLGISRKTVSKWINQGQQGSNENVEKMLWIAKILIPQELPRILLEDLSRHQDNIHTFLDN